MTEQCFQDQMRRLADTWGIEAFPLPRVEEIFAECEDLSDFSFVKIVTRIIGEHPIKWPPTVKEFREFGQAERKRLMDSPPAEPTPSPRDAVKEFKTSEEALTNVSGFYNELISRYEDKEAVGKAFVDEAVRILPALNEEVQTLKRLVQAGSIEARATYVAKARSLILKTFVSLALRDFKTFEKVEGEEKARRLEAAKKFKEQLKAGG